MNRLRVSTRRGERELLLEGTIVVGRDARCDIVDEDPMLSRRHAEFVVSPSGTVVRDLNSRNGIRVNGVKLAESLLRPGDVVQVADLRIEWVVDSPEDDTRDDTADVAEPFDADDRTVAVAPPPGAGAPSAARAPAAVAAGDEERTTILRAPPPAVGAPAPAPPAARPAAEPAKPAAPPRAPRRASRSWGGRALLAMLVLAMLVFLVTALPMLMWHRRVLNDAAVARAGALASWLAAETGAALRAGGAGLPDVGARVAREPGVIAYVILTPRGEVRAPAARVGETIAKLPGIDEAPEQVLRLRAAWHGDQIEVALPVTVGDDPRAAIAALSFRPSAAPGESGSAAVLGPLLALALVLGWLAAFRLRRSTIGALTAFNEDVDLLLAGQLTAVADPLGTKPTNVLAQTLNYLASRVRAGDRREAPRAAEPGTVPAPAAAAWAGPPTGATAVPGAVRTAALPAEARLVVSPAFRIEEASPECRDVVGVASDALTGQHLLDAIPDKAILDAVLKCLSRLPAAGEEALTVAPEGKPYRVAVRVQRTSRDQPIAITMTPVSGPAA